MVRTFDWIPNSPSDRLLIFTGSLSFAVAAWFLFFAPLTLDFDATSAQIGQVKAQGKIRRRHARVLQWEDISADSPIYLRDIIYVPEGASAQVILKGGKQIELAPESLVQFDDITIHEIEISLWDKVKTERAHPRVFRLLPLPKPPKSGVLPDTLDLSIVQTELVQRLETIHKKTAELLEVKKVPPAPRFALRSLQDYDVYLGNPEDGAKIALNGERWMKMVWSPVPILGVTYELLMSRDRSFKQQIPHQTQSTSVNVQFQDAGKYYWRVRVRRDAESVISPISEFEMVMPKGAKRGVAGQPPAGRPIAPLAH